MPSQKLRPIQKSAPGLTGHRHECAHWTKVLLYRSTGRDTVIDNDMVYRSTALLVICASSLDTNCSHEVSVRFGQ